MRRNNEVSLFDLFNDMFNYDYNDMKADVKETESNYVVEAELPGFDKKDINVSYQDGTLTIKAVVNEESNDEKKKYIRKERRIRSVERSFYLGDIDEEKISAKMENGILIINLPKLAIAAPKENHILIE